MSRLVNVYVVQSLSTNRRCVTTVTIRSGADGTPEPALEHAGRTGSWGSVIHDVHTGER
jgi:hypothetical protein